MRDADDEPDDELDDDELEDDELEDDELEDDELDDDLDVEIDDPDDADSEELDEEFPMGESPDDSALVSCPYCGEGVEITLDPGGGAYQEYVEDCHVCCQPWRVEVRYDPSGIADVQATALDD